MISSSPREELKESMIKEDQLIHAKMDQERVWGGDLEALAMGKLFKLNLVILNMTTKTGMLVFMFWSWVFN
jgi:hypothetical protein